MRQLMVSNHPSAHLQRIGCHPESSASVGSVAVENVSTFLCFIHDSGQVLLLLLLLWWLWFEMRSLNSSGQAWDLPQSLGISGVSAFTPTFRCEVQEMPAWGH